MGRLRKARSIVAIATAICVKRRHPVLQQRQLIGDIRRHQIAPRRQHLAELHKNGPQPLQRLTQTLPARRTRGRAPPTRCAPVDCSQGCLEAGEHQLIQAKTQYHPDDGGPARKNCFPWSGTASTLPARRCPPAGGTRSLQKAAYGLAPRCPGQVGQGVRRHVPDHTRQIVLYIPAQVVGQPVGYRRQATHPHQCARSGVLRAVRPAPDPGATPA
jgi:hypothetical protein